jgi:hypothetical protein
MEPGLKMPDTHFIVTGFYRSDCSINIEIYRKKSNRLADILSGFFMGIEISQSTQLCNNYPENEYHCQR